MNRDPIFNGRRCSYIKYPVLTLCRDDQYISRGNINKPLHTATGYTYPRPFGEVLRLDYNLVYIYQITLYIKDDLIHNRTSTPNSYVILYHILSYTYYILCFYWLERQSVTIGRVPRFLNIELLGDHLDSVQPRVG